MRIRHRGICRLVSLVLCFTIIVAWVSGYIVPKFFPLYRGEQRSFYLGSGSGTIVLRRATITETSLPVLENVTTGFGLLGNPFHSSKSAPPPPAPSRGASPGGSFEFCWFFRVDSRLGATLNGADLIKVTGRVDQIAISDWLLVALFGVAPTIWLVRLRTRRHVIGHCITCGYDLRATPERCPECGTAAMRNAD